MAFGGAERTEWGAGVVVMEPEVAHRGSLALLWSSGGASLAHQACHAHQVVGSPNASAWRTTASKNCRATTCCNSRPRFLLKVDWSKLGSIRLMSRNHRHSNWKSNSSQNARSLRTEYRLISRLALSNRSGGIDGRPPVRYMASKVGDNSTSARSAQRLMTRNGWWGGTRSSRSTNANMLA